MQPLSRDQLVQVLDSFEENSRVNVKYSHVRDATTIRTAIGVISKRGDGTWNIKRSTTSHIVLPNDDLIVFEVGHRLRSESRPRSDEETVIIEDTRRNPPQPQAANHSPIHVLFAMKS